MSEKIYFNTSQRFSVKRSLVNISTRLHHTLAPSHAKKTARKLLLTPARTQPKNAEPQGLVKAEIQGHTGAIKTYSLGQGPVWVLTHGWSGTASQFYPLMEHIAACGFTALAYDHPAHGESDGQYGHIPGFVRGLEEVLDSVEEGVAGLVGHSMGTASALECRHHKLENKPLLLIAPVLNYVENLFGSIARSGYSMKLFKAVVSEVEDQYGYPLQSIDPLKRLSERAAPMIIVHDEQDKFTKHSISAQAADEIENVELVTTQGQGHGRVMKCEQVFSGFDRLIERV
ncbi:alpha/beta fold hydrolase [Vibrio parahaemolyticus]|uniref:alpha/beta fold hydrolase n=1 Tax=Vibrio parahaemolyticus TaxID=670 RepID=UPI0010E629EA|nr:alpha/beta fold hydrolase [Vibrio parahaemolyticus]MBE3810752.1 alpha/beta hydrolase [Vibrio parahaemolyticus]MBE4457419.1 alpha/beta hydrolase [Vibrio parahaemolyticus]MDF4330071.1 alpha/beta fold hydrolase [Vibrio parahaemolyticus]TBT18337.1 alpha/beta fold hydrolase [Vibrio parahaemolyticus]TOG66164.1 alpha/beta hydrolase [Vibrio parahaemolyticus]